MDFKDEIIGETIRSITERAAIYDSENMEGYIIKTDNFIIKCLIRGGQSCCEDFGYLSTPDNIDEFIDAVINGIDIVEIDKGECGNIDSEEKINIDTDKGLLQLSVYQSHNGYYGHGTEVEIERINHG